jgi:hypothetical protein
MTFRIPEVSYMCTYTATIDGTFSAIFYADEGRHCLRVFFRCNLNGQIAQASDLTKIAILQNPVDKPRIILHFPPKFAIRDTNFKSTRGRHRTISRLEYQPAS